MTASDDAATTTTAKEFKRILSTNYCARTPKKCGENKTPITWINTGPVEERKRQVAPVLAELSAS
jgi:hypothetical protein